jgi:hypothetical protein
MSSEEAKKVEDVLADARRQYEEGETKNLGDIVISALRRAVIECERIFVTTTELKKAGFMNKNYAEEIARLTGQDGTVIKQRCGQTDIYYLRGILEDAKKFILNIK